MTRTCARIWLALAALLFLASGQWLAASCSVDEPTYTTFRESPSGDWCAETSNTNCYYIRKDTASGQQICSTGSTTVEWDLPNG